VHTGFRWRNLRKTDHLEDPGTDERIIIIIGWIFRNWDVGVRTGSMWLRIETGGRPLLFW